jgi:hypothetical protein
VQAVNVEVEVGQRRAIERRRGMYEDVSGPEPCGDLTNRRLVGQIDGELAFSI